MFATTKKKKVLKLVLLISLITIVFAGVGLGIYFLVRDNSEAVLAKRQAAFGSAINNSSTMPQQTEFDVSLLPATIQPQNVVVANDKYVLVKTNNSDYVVYDVASQSYVGIGAKLNYISVLGVYGKFAIVETPSSTVLFNLETLNVVAVLDNVSYNYSSQHLLLTARDCSTIAYYENNQVVQNISAILFNTETGACEFKALTTENIINVTLSENILIAYYQNKLDVYTIGSQFSLSKTYNNVYDASFEGKNVTSFLTGAKYYISDYYRAFVLGQGLVLVERCMVVSAEESDIVGTLSNGLRRNYKNTYVVLDLVRNVEFEVSSQGKVVTPFNANLPNNYFAVIRTEIDNKQTLIQDKQTIEYYQIVKEKGEYKLFSLVEYDYQKYGKLIGFDNSGLFTTDGSESRFIDFEGNAKEFSGLGENKKVTLSNYDHTVVITNLLGEKKVYNVNGDLISESVYSRVSPTVKGNAIALKGTKFYRVNSKDGATLISGFASEFAQYVFMGSGYYFTGSSENYSVYNFEGKLLYSGVDINVSYNKLSHKIVISIVGQDVKKLFLVTPVETEMASQNIINSFVNNEDFKQETEPEIKTAAPEEAISISQTIIEKGDVNSREFLYYELTSEDQDLGGIATLDYYFRIDNLEGGLTYRAYNDLNAREAKLVPNFDKGTTTNQHIYRYGEEENEFLNFIGVNFVADDRSHITIAISKLQDNKSGKFYYMVTLAVKDAYIMNVSDSTCEVEISESKKVNTKLKFYDYINEEVAIAGTSSIVNGKRTLALSSDAMLDKIVGYTFLDGSEKPDQTPYEQGEAPNIITITPRQLDIGGAGFDGGLLLATDNTNALELKIKLSNVYRETNQRSKSVNSSSGKVDCGSYYLTFSGTQVVVEAKPGYVLTGFSVEGLAYSDAASGAECFDKTGLSFDQAIVKATYDVGYYNYVRLSNVSVVENYSYVELHRFDKEAVHKVVEDEATGNKTFYYFDEEGTIIEERENDRGNLLGYYYQNGDRVENEEELKLQPMIEIKTKEEPTELGKFYYFYGFADDIKDERNPARLGFENFENKTRIEVFESGLDVEGFTFEYFTVYEFEEDLVEEKPVKFYPLGETLSIIDKNGELVQEGENNYVIDSALAPSKAGAGAAGFVPVAVYTLEAIYEAKEFNIMYFVDEARYNQGTLHISKDNQPIKTPLKYFSTIGTNEDDSTYELYSLVDDATNMEYWSLLLGKSLYGSDFLGWYYKTTDADGSVVEKRLNIGDAFTTVGDLKVYAKWKDHFYKIVFDANVYDDGAYQGVTVGGYVYNIEGSFFGANYACSETVDDFLANSYNLTYSTGDIFYPGDSTIYQYVWFNKPFANRVNQWPTVDIKVGVHNNYEEYIFLGWYSEKEVPNESASYEAVVEGMKKYTAGSSITLLEDTNNDGAPDALIPEDTFFTTDADGNKVLTLYAHYKRVVYQYNLETSVDSVAKDDQDQDILYTEKITSEAATNKGVKDIYSSTGNFASYNSGSGFENRECLPLNPLSELNTKSNQYVLYGIQNETMKVHLFPNTGYYISKIRIDFVGESTPYIITGEWQNTEMDVYTLEILDSDLVKIYVDGFNVCIEMCKRVYPLYNETSPRKDILETANISVEFTSMKFKNTFTVSGLDSQDNELENGDGRVVGPTGAKITEHDNIIYGWSNIYKLFSGITTSPTFANSYLHSIYLGEDKLIELSYEYVRENVSIISSTDPVYYHKISSTNSLKSSEWVLDDSTVDNKIYKKDIYVLKTDSESGAELIYLVVTYQYSAGITKQNSYTYELYVKNKENQDITVCFKDIRVNVEFELYDEDYDGSANGLLEKDSTDFKNRVSVTPSIGEGFYGSYYTPEVVEGETPNLLAPNTHLTYKVLPTDRYFINSISIEYNGSSTHITYPSVAIGVNESGIYLLQTSGLQAFGETSTLRLSGDTVYHEATNITITWSDAKGFVVSVGASWHDVKIKVTVLEYKLFQVQTPGTPLDTFTISESLKNAMSRQLPSVGSLVEKNVYYKQETGILGTSGTNINYCNWLIVGKQTIEDVVLKPRIDGSISYKVQSWTPSDDEIIEKTTNADDEIEMIYHINNALPGGNKASVTLTVDQANIVVNSYLGRGTENKESISASISNVVPKTNDGQLYTLDTNAFYFGTNSRGPFSKITATYTNPLNGVSTNKQYNSVDGEGSSYAYINVSFTGGEIKVVVNKIKGYMLSTLIVEFYLVENQAGGVGSSTENYIIKTDCVEVDGDNNQKIITLTIPKLDNSRYELRLFQKPIEYEVEYNKVEDASNQPTGTVNVTKHLYNVPSTINTSDKFEKEGYTLIGYSKTKKTGINLTPADCDFLLPGFVDSENADKSSAIIENLWEGYEADSNKKTTLYAVYQANKYTINYIFNDASLSKGSSFAEVVSQNTLEVAFDQNFGTLQEIKRFGYTFVGWFTLEEGGNKLTGSTKLDVHLFEIIKNEEDDQKVDLYAHYTANTYTIKTDKNDSSNSNGSSLATVTGSTSQTIVFDSATNIAYPAITRVGYDMKGYRSVRTTALDAEALTNADYIDQTTYKTLNWGFISSNGFDVEEIESSKTINIFATYVAQIFDVYIHLNNESLKNYNSEVSVTYNNTTYKTTTYNVDGLKLTVKFDGVFGVLPTVYNQGYTLMGFYIEKLTKQQAETTESINDATEFNIDTYNDATFIGLPSSKSFYIFACFETQELRVSYEGSLENHMEEVSNALSYSNTGIGTLVSGKNSIVGEYGSDIVLDILPSEGYYIKTLSISYLDETGATKTITIAFTWKDVDKTITYTISTGQSSASNGFTLIGGNHSTIINNIYMKAYTYAQSSLGRNTFRIVLAFDFLKGPINVTTEQESQTFTATFDGVARSPLQYGSSNIAGGVPIPSLGGQSFDGWYDKKTGSRLLTSDKIYENKDYEARYVTDTSSPSVTFYAWNPESRKYEIIEVLEPAGGSGGVITQTMPSPSSDAWPVGYYFTGWDVRSSAPGSYIVSEQGDFNGKYKVYGAVKVYSCYYSKKPFVNDSFSITSSIREEENYRYLESKPFSSSSQYADGTIFTSTQTVRQKVQFYVNINVKDLYKHVYKKSGEFAPVDFFDYVMCVKALYSKPADVESALSASGVVIKSPIYTGDKSYFEERICLTYYYTYTITRTYEVDVWYTDIMEPVYEDVKDEEGNVIGQVQVGEKDSGRDQRHQSISCTNTTNDKSDCYDAAYETKNKDYYFVVYLQNRSTSDILNRNGDENGNGELVPYIVKKTF